MKANFVLEMFLKKINEFYDGIGDIWYYEIKIFVISRIVR